VDVASLTACRAYEKPRDKHGDAAANSDKHGVYNYVDLNGAFSRVDAARIVKG